MVFKGKFSRRPEFETHLGQNFLCRAPMHITIRQSVALVSLNDLANPPMFIKHVISCFIDACLFLSAVCLSD